MEFWKKLVFQYLALYLQISYSFVFKLMPLAARDPG